MRCPVGVERSIRYGGNSFVERFLQNNAGKAGERRKTVSGAVRWALTE